MSKVLFILKRREDYQAVLHSNIGLSTGLFNSASFVNNMLNDIGVESHLEVAIDNNCIDRLVNTHKPTHVIIEALWVVPTKFAVLQQLHPDVTWIIRLHSEMPFMAGEGMAMDWIGEYSKFRNVIIAVNAPRMLRETKLFLEHMHNWNEKTVNKKVIYLPNFYPQEYKHKTLNKDKDVIDIGCFGAVRPLKNHLLQAFGAIEFADSIGKKLHFHINSGRVEMQGGPVAHNLRGLFAHLYNKGHRLVNHVWTPREQFLELCGQMDVCLQSSFSETFNIVGADVISQGVPLVGCSEIPWQMSGLTDPTSSQDICVGLQTAYRFPQFNVKLNQFGLTHYTNKTRRVWAKYFKGKRK
jgi:hypothetical protein